MSATDGVAPVRVRALSSADAAFLERMMLIAGFRPDRELPADAAQLPHVRHFLDGWGRAGDVGVIAVGDHGAMGAAWARVLDEPLLRDGRGAPVPELAIAVEEPARNRDVGRTLLDALAEAAASAGHRELSLKVSPSNPAHRLYLRCGFELVSEGEHGLVMRRRLVGVGPPTHISDDITADLVVALLRDQHSDLAELPVTFGAAGWDNQLWRLGDELAVRLPWATDDASELLLKEYSLVPQVASDLPLRTPVPRRLGQPSRQFPHPWLVTTWVPGEPADRAPVTRGDAAADALGSFLGALHRPAPADAPAGRHRRGGPLADNAVGFAALLDQATDRGLIADPDAVRAAWRDALSAPEWTGRPVWLHGDLHPANVLTSHGSICGVIDFGDLCAGDPACDLAGGWLLLPGSAMDRFHRAYGSADAATLRRARGWALIKALACVIIGDNGAKGLPGGKPTWAPPATAALRRLTRRAGPTVSP